MLHVERRAANAAHRQREIQFVALKAWTGEGKIEAHRRYADPQSSFMVFQGKPSEAKKSSVTPTRMLR